MLTAQDRNMLEKQGGKKSVFETFFWFVFLHQETSTHNLSTSRLSIALQMHWLGLFHLPSSYVCVWLAVYTAK